ncbi:MAG TPA: amidohydrolase family protein, partial [Byssovorax sp.]
PAEVEACVAETGLRPVELLADRGVLGPRFVAVHATELLAHEARLLGEADARVCLCPTTERDLGDGLPDLGALVDAGVALCTGIDSHVITNPLEDLRCVELGERSRTKRRVVLPPGEHATPAERLWHIGSRSGDRACGFDDDGGALEIDAAHPELALVPRDRLLDAVVYAASPAVLRPRQ